MPKCTINGIEVEVPAGTSIIQAYKKIHQDIAHYCWHPGLSVAGVCRLCMVEIQGNPKLQIACNTLVADGMVINNNSEKVKDTVKWGLDFHLINHPLDCPICDQAGECGLQDQYMQFGKYDSEMAERKVKKKKVVSLGERVMLDSERCILCSRCVRFCDEVPKTRELGIFERGDHSEIGTFEGKPLNNNYSLNTVDICPVGALTSVDFRFRQRVWYLKDADSICTGCSTGCNTKVYFNEEGLWRTKPRENPEVNGHWMCDKGRDTYKFVNKTARLTEARVRKQGTTQNFDPIDAVKQLKKAIETAAIPAEQIALVLTGQYTNEEYTDLLDFVGGLKTKNIFHWVNNPETVNEFDGILYRGDRNPNTRGLRQTLEKVGGAKDWSNLKTELEAGRIKWLFVAGPENQSVFPDLEEKVKLFLKAEKVVWLTAGPITSLDKGVSGEQWQIPLRTYFEKNGTYVNFNGISQKVKVGTVIVDAALTISEVVHILKGQELDLNQRPKSEPHIKTNFFTHVRGTL